MYKKLLILLIVFGIISCNKKENADSGISYKILNSSGDTTSIVSGDQITLNMYAVIDRNDSVLFDTYKSSKPLIIPFDEPTLSTIFSKVHKGDSVEFWVNADTLYNKSMGKPVPNGLLSNDIVHFWITINNVYNVAEMQKQMETVKAEAAKKDAEELTRFLSDKPNIQKTPSGLMYQIISKGKGKKVVSGNEVKVNYKGSLLNGTVFDETKSDRPPFTFIVGAGQVIKGWDEGLQLMSEGDVMQLIIPSDLGYGDDGTGPIPPHATLVFEIKLLEVK